MAACTHLDDAPTAESAPAGQTCPECVEAGSSWVHLRRCLACGHVGCCDSSPLRHATAHFTSSSHPVIQSFEPGEHWRWCYPDEVMG